MPAPLIVPLGEGTPGSTAHARHLPRSKAPRRLHPSHLRSLATTYKVIDVSGYQRGINLAPIFAGGVDGVICKATESTTYYNSDLPRVIGQAHDAGKVGAAYHFLRPGQGKQQADWFLSKTAGLIAPGTRMVLDVEAGTHNDAHDFTMEVQAAGWGQMIYTGGWYWNGLGAATCQHCAGFPLWESGYTSTQPGPLKPWQRVALWQFSDRATVPGWSTGVDMSVTTDLAVLTGGTPTPAPEDDMTPEQAQALADTNAKVTEALAYIYGMNGVPGGKGEPVGVGVWTTPIDGPGGVKQQPAAAVLSTAMSAALGAAAGSDPGAIADHLASSLGPDLAKQVLQALAAKLGQ